MNIADLRAEYSRGELDEATSHADPLQQFARWWDEATRSEIREVNAMTLATADAVGRPGARTVLLKDFDARGFVFYTNYESRKGHELDANPRASLLFFWKELERQVRIEGLIEKTSDAESDDYFASRPLGSRLAAIASPQSAVIADRRMLEERYAEAEKRYGTTPRRPPNWGGFRVMPEAIEFWQGRPNRLHDRLLYRRTASGDWDIVRLAP